MPVIFATEAPRTLRIPISLTLFCAANVASPHSPRHEISIAKPENIWNKVYSLDSDLYKASNCSSRKLNSKTSWGNAFFHADSIATIVSGILLEAAIFILTLSYHGANCVINVGLISSCRDAMLKSDMTPVISALHPFIPIQNRVPNAALFD